MQEQFQIYLNQLEIALGYAGQLALKTHKIGAEEDPQKHLLLALHAMKAAA